MRPQNTVPASRGLPGMGVDPASGRPILACIARLWYRSGQYKCLARCSSLVLEVGPRFLDRSAGAWGPKIRYLQVGVCPAWALIQLVAVQYSLVLLVSGADLANTSA